MSIMHNYLKFTEFIDRIVRFDRIEASELLHVQRVSALRATPQLDRQQAGRVTCAKKKTNVKGEYLIDNFN